MLEVHSEPGDGLLGVVTRAQEAVLTQTEDPIGVLGIELVSHPEDSVSAFGIEAAYGEHLGQGVVERLDVHFALEAKEPPDRALLDRIFGEFGGVDFTSVCLRRGEDGAELMDVTLHFSPKVRWLAHCTALIAEELDPKEIEGCRSVLAALKLKHSARGASLAVAKRQLRRPLVLDDQVTAFERGLKAGLSVEVYCATLPTTRSSRIVVRSNDGFDVVAALSRKLEKESKSAARDAVVLRDFVDEALGLDFGDRDWRVENAHGDRREHHAHGPMGERRPLEWSLNFGAKRR